MSKKRNVVLTSLTTIALSASVAVGGTFALFTSESKVNIAVTSGNGNLRRLGELSLLPCGWRKGRSRGSGISVRRYCG